MTQDDATQESEALQGPERDLEYWMQLMFILAVAGTGVVVFYMVIQHGF